MKETNMNILQLNELLEHIKSDHSFCNYKNGRSVKYVSFTFDTRTNTVYHIKFDDKILARVNENRKRDLFKWANAWLDNKDDGFNFERDDKELFDILHPKEN
jgi:hypothetical protein